LNSLGIRVISDLPVGDNLQDHPATGVEFYFNSSVSYDVISAFSPVTIAEYYAFKKNELTSNLAEGLIFVKTKYENQTDDWPDIEMTMVPGIN
jgi:hypothetical protein